MQNRLSALHKFMFTVFHRALCLSTCGGQKHVVLTMHETCTHSHPDPTHYLRDLPSADRLAESRKRDSLPMTSAASFASSPFCSLSLTTPHIIVLQAADGACTHMGRCADCLVKPFRPYAFRWNPSVAEVSAYIRDWSLC